LFTRLYLWIRALPEWLSAARKKNPWLFAEWWIAPTLPILVIANFLSFRDDVAFLILLVALPALWALASPFLEVRAAREGIPFGDRAMRVLPLVSALFADVLGTLAIVYGRGAFGGGASVEFYLLFLATVLRIGLIAVRAIRPYRGKAVVDVFVRLLSLSFSFILYALAITA